MLRSWLLLVLCPFVLVACSGESAPADPPPPPPAVDLSDPGVQDPGSALAADWEHSGVFMEVFVRSFRDSDGDGIGDLKGLTDSLDYLQDLGIKGLWLMPITASQDHDFGYAVEDYRSIEEAYGDTEDLQELLQQAHARGIGILLDYVPNHSGATNPMFLDARSATNAFFRPWYVIERDKPLGWAPNGNGLGPWYEAGTGWYYASFWSEMPEFDFTNPAVLAYHRNNLRFWLNQGVDGFRFDAIDSLVEDGPGRTWGLPESRAVMTQLRGVLNSYSQRYAVCESVATPALTAADGVCGSAFAFDLRSVILDVARGQTDDLPQLASYFTTNSQNMATLLVNHDSFTGPRVFDQMGGNEAQYRLAAATYLTLPGIPFLYYGEEIGIANGTGLSGDPALRVPMSWTGDTATAGFTTGTPYRALASNVATHNVAAQQADPNSLYHFYRTLIRLRASTPALARGSYEQPRVTGQVFSFQRRAEGSQVLVVINYADATSTTTVTGLPASATLTGLTGETAQQADGSGHLSLTLPSRSVRLYAF